MENLQSQNPLNILMVNWVWFQVGGDWTYVDNVRKLYQGKGHNVIPFAMKSDKDFDSYGYDKYFVDFIDYKKLNANKSALGAIKALTKSIYSKQAKVNMEKLLTDTRIDIAHLHNINHYITPSILPVLKKHKVPVVWTLHDYTLICPENSFISHGSICEKCKGGKFIQCGINKCKKDSYLASSLAGLENYVHRYMHLFKHVDYFLCPSEFLYKKFYEFNFFRDKLRLTNLCFNFNREALAAQEKIDGEKYILYVGRLEKIKGVTTLLKAVSGLNIPLKIVGGGNLQAEIQAYINTNNLTNVQLLGHKTLPEVYNLVTNAEFTVCPSEWYENYPFSVIEAMSFKKAIVGARIGGIPELINDGKTGLLFESFNADDLREKIVKLWGDDNLKREFGENAFQFISNQVSYERHYGILKDIYSNLNVAL
jgi:glycosyltransferase involved in cell wall biosynthesis